MKQIFARALRTLMVLLLLAPVYVVGALALSGSDPLLHADLDRADFAFDYVPQANSEYALYLFSADGGKVSARAEILAGGEVIASGEGSGEILSAWLAEGRNYEVRVHGSGNALIEMARCALSRSQGQPLLLDENDPYEKSIAHQYDAHWYAFNAQADTPMLLFCQPGDDMNLSALLFDENGNFISAFESLSGGAASLRYETVAGRRYFLRVSAPAGGEGYYTVSLNRPEAGSETKPYFDSASLVLAAGSEASLKRETGEAALVFISDDPTVLRAENSGVITGLRPGKTAVTAYGLDGSARLEVEVVHVPLEGLRFFSSEMTLSTGDDADIPIEFFPENASDTRVRFSVENPAIASVNSSGVLRALQPGQTKITVSSLDGAFSDSFMLTVNQAPPRYRALLVGEENYPFADDPRRDGSENSVAAIKSLLGTVEFENAAYSVRMEKDISRSELISAIRQTFLSATERDVSLLYITCHGSYSGGMSFLELSDGSVLSVRDLERELREISGTVVVMIDSCASGGAIGAYSDRLAFAKGVTGAFSGAGIRGGKYRVIASAGLDEDSFRIAFNDSASSGVMATVFSRALCDGAGWDIDRNVRSTMGADFDYDGKITLAEMQVYLQERVSWYLGVASGLTGENYRQTIQVYPEGDPLVLFERN